MITEEDEKLLLPETQEALRLSRETRKKVAEELEKMRSSEWYKANMI